MYYVIPIMFLASMGVLFWGVHQQSLAKEAAKERDEVRLKLVDLGIGQYFKQINDRMGFRVLYKRGGLETALREIYELIYHKGDGGPYDGPLRATIGVIIQEAFHANGSPKATSIPIDWEERINHSFYFRLDEGLMYRKQPHSTNAERCQVPDLIRILKEMFSKEA